MNKWISFLSYRCSFFIIFIVIACLAVTGCAIEPPIPNHFYSFEEIQAILNVIKSNGGEKVTFLGGEPTEHPHLMEIIELAKSMNFESVPSNMIF